VLSQAAGSLWYTLLDAVTGFNHIVNTDRARQMLAILSRSGQFLPRCLTFGPANGPEDFCYVIDRVYAPGKKGARRFCKEWLGYVDDLTIRTGREVDGVQYTDAEYDAFVGGGGDIFDADKCREVFMESPIRGDFFRAQSLILEHNMPYVIKYLGINGCPFGRSSTI
jgi:hypothetical protein